LKYPVDWRDGFGMLRCWCDGIIWNGCCRRCVKTVRQRQAMRIHPSSRSDPKGLQHQRHASSHGISAVPEARRGFANHGTSPNSGQRDGKFAALEFRAPRSLRPSPLVVGPSQVPSPRLPDLKMADPDHGGSQKGEAWETWAGRGM
jgi:hypothetical protein